MAAPKKAKESDSLDDLLNFDDVVAETPVVVEDAEPVVADADLPLDTKTEEVAPVETAEQKRIRELQNALAAPAPLANTNDVQGNPLPESVLTPEQIQIRQLEDQLAIKKAKELEAAPEQWDTSEGVETVIIHIVEDGFTALGRVWYIGQEIEFVKGGRAYNDTKDRNGSTWLDLDENGQIDRYGKIYFRLGEWRGKTYEISEAAAEERKRRRKAPILSS